MILDLAVTTVVNGELLLSELGGVATTDARLTDARTPLPHEHPMSDVLGLVAALFTLTAAITAASVDGEGVLNRLLTDGADVWVSSDGDVLWR